MSDLRQDPVSGDWIIMAPERAKRLNQLIKNRKRKLDDIKKCPFEDLKKTGNWPPILVWDGKKILSDLNSNSDKSWQIVLIPNKYPALKHNDNLCATNFKNGPFNLKSGTGVHNLIVFKNHFKGLADLNFSDFFAAFLMLQKHYLDLSKDKCLIYTSTFCNYGAQAGASLSHLHFQVLTLPIIPPDINSSLNGSKKYFQKNKKCIHCDMIKFDLTENKRIIFKNNNALAITPFISRTPFEIRIFPLKHIANFEKTPLNDLKSVIEALHFSLKQIKSKLGDPDLNFFIHTAPLKDGKYNYYHWHIEILPKISTLGGFEISTGIEINVFDPYAAAKILKK
ncbi:MAG: galactose-1-phosphate uridylyltransferase [Minisyncoccia bacterium]